MSSEMVKKDFDFGWKTRPNKDIAELALRYNRGDILDVGCGTCQLAIYLRKRGWKGKYVGIDTEKYADYSYPRDVSLIIGDASSVALPQTGTCVLYSVLEHVNDPIKIVSKCLKVSKKNVLINVPKRNEELWKWGVVEYHQLDKSHKHCGFTKDEMVEIIKKAGGKIVTQKEIGLIDVSVCASLWKNKIPRNIVKVLRKIFPSKRYYQEMWFEVERAK